VHQAKVLRFFPHLVAGEGLFVACLRKTNADETPFKWRSRGKNQPNKNELKIVSEWLSADAPEVALMNLQETVISLPKYLEADIQCIAENFYLRKAGTRIGQISPKELIPDHELALSCFLNRENCATIELTLPQALSYLRRDDFELDLPQRGWLCACYEGVPLGWMKSLGNRFNNYYPKEWRVQMR
jgi:NOL1/NOP2/fmu family ribosome biogenesis protein